MGQLDNTAQELYESWLNGNRNFVINEIENLPTIQAMYIVGFICSQPSFNAEVQVFLNLLEKRANA